MHKPFDHPSYILNLFSAISKIEPSGFGRWNIGFHNKTCLIIDTLSVFMFYSHWNFKFSELRTSTILFNVILIFDTSCHKTFLLWFVSPSHVLCKDRSVLPDTQPIVVNRWYMAAIRPIGVKYVIKSMHRLVLVIRTRRLSRAWHKRH